MGGIHPIKNGWFMSLLYQHSNGPPAGITAVIRRGSASASAFASLAFWAAFVDTLRRRGRTEIQRNLRRCVDSDAILHDVCNNNPRKCVDYDVVLHDACI